MLRVELIQVTQNGQFYMNQYLIDQGFADEAEESALSKVKKDTVNILLNARAFIQNSTFTIEGDGRLLEATLFGNFQAFIYRI